MWAGEADESHGKPEPRESARCGRGGEVSVATVSRVMNSTQTVAYSTRIRVQ